MSSVIWLLLAYWQARNMKFQTRAELEQHQAHKLKKFMRVLCLRSRYFAPFKARPLAQWPLMDKSVMLANFDTMNTAGLTLVQVMNAAQNAERSRDFRPHLNGITVGLSSGTTGQRAAFAVNAREKAQWAGIMLARALPDGLFAGERVALFLRANSNLYTAVRSPWLTFAFFDLFKPFEQNLLALARYQPSVIVAPAQVLRQLALAALAGTLQVKPRRVISVAEVLEPQDRALIEKAFGRPHEIYQATEGFLASTCEQGVLHLNEEYVHVEREWLDAAHTRFVPVITDFSRLTQPIVRYRLNDVLAVRPKPCICGRVTLALNHIEGRCDDMLVLPGLDGNAVSVFSDALSRALAQALPMDADYRLFQNDVAALQLHALLDADALQAVQTHLVQALKTWGVDTASLVWSLHPELPAFDPTQKRRRIVRRVLTRNHQEQSNAQ